MRRSRRLDANASLQVAAGVHPDAVHLLTEFVLNLALSATGENDLTPLYESYIGDGRLGDTERQELMWVYMSLQLRSAGTARTLGEAGPQAPSGAGE